MSDKIGQCFAPQLIVLRVVSGRAWTRDKSSMFGQDTRLEFTGRSTTRIDAEESEKEKVSHIMVSSASNSSSDRVEVV